MIDQKPLTSDPAPSKPYPSRQPLATQPNGASRLPPKSSDATEYQYSSHLMPNRVDALGRKRSEVSAAGSEPDSLLELYKGGSESRKNSYHIGAGDARKASQGVDRNDEDDESKWIHRDKLAQIESRELEEAGLRARGTSRSNPPSRSASHSRHRRNASLGDTSEDIKQDDGINGHYPPLQERRQHAISPILASEASENGDVDHDPRTRDEAAAEHEREQANQGARQHIVRPNTSRIPLAKTSPAPVPRPLVAGDSPRPRSRGGSGLWSGLYENGVAVSKTRDRSATAESAVLPDDMDDSAARSRRGTSMEATSPPTSPPKARVPSKTTPTSGSRKTSRATSGAKPRATSATHKDSPRRPGTSSGASRPATARPEGEAPWIATMYKPDPRLPPEEQMLPTHAKKLAQEQWEREGKTGSVYDTEFRLLNTDDFARPEAKPKEEQAPEPQKEEEQPPQWPLSTPPTEKAESDNLRPGNGGSQHGGYSTMPAVRVPSPQVQQRSSSSTPPAKVAPPIRPATETRSSTTVRPTERIRVQDPPDKEGKEKKSCGCCVVM